MYMRVTTIAHALLMLVSQPAAHTRWLLALGPSPPCPSVSSTPLPLHGRTIKVLGTLGGTYDRFKATFGVQRLTARRPRPRSFGPCNGPGALPLCTCVFQLLHTLYSCVYPSLQPAHSSYPPCTTLEPLLSLLAGFPTAPALHRCTINVLGTLRGMYNRFKASFGVQRLTT